VGRLADGKFTSSGPGPARELPFIFMGAGAVTGVRRIRRAGGQCIGHTRLSKPGSGVQVFASHCERLPRPSDTADKIDMRNGQVAGDPKEAIDYLAARLSAEFSGSAPAAQTRGPAAPNSVRRVATASCRHDRPGRRRRVSTCSRDPARKTRLNQVTAPRARRRQDLQSEGLAIAQSLRPGNGGRRKFARDTAI